MHTSCCFAHGFLTDPELHCTALGLLACHWCELNRLSRPVVWAHRVPMVAPPSLTRFRLPSPGRGAVARSPLFPCWQARCLLQYQQMQMELQSGSVSCRLWQLPWERNHHRLQSRCCKLADRAVHVAWLVHSRAAQVIQSCREHPEAHSASQSSKMPHTPSANGMR